jgi:non-specific serine/threonine protein kinase
MGEGAASADASRLPAELSSFVGREQEVPNLAELVGGHRLVTLTGPGGVGKTRLALQVARLLERQHRMSPWLVELSRLSEGDPVEEAAVASLGLRHVAGRPARELVAEHLRHETALLLLDNCEHVVEAAAPFVEYLLVACPTLRVLATSREPLMVGGEQVCSVPPLELPEPGQELRRDALTRYSALRLFAQRAEEAAGVSFDRPEDLRAMARVCRRVDALPLAVELAAARTRAMSPGALLARLEEEGGFRALGAGKRTADDRHRTIRATVEWSYRLLTDQERLLFARLSIFAVRFDLNAAEQVGALPPVQREAVLELLTGLIEKSLITIVPVPSGEYRYRLLATLRAFGLERLLESGDYEAVRERQAAHYADLLGGHSLSWTREGLDELYHQLDDVRAAVTWGCANQPELVTLICVRMVGFWGRHGPLSEGREWMASIVGKLPRDDVHKAIALANASWLAQRQGDFEAAGEYADESLHIRSQIGDAVGIADGLTRLSDIARLRGDTEAARRDIEEAVAIVRADGSPQDLALALMMLGSVEGHRGEMAAGRRHLEEAMGLFESSGELSGIAYCQGWLGELALSEGSLSAAGELLTGALRAFRDMRDPWMVAILCDLLGALAALRSDPHRGLRLAGAAVAVRNAVGASQPPALAALVSPPLERARRSVSSGGRAAWQQGVESGSELAIAYALRETEWQTPAQRAPGGLTARELEVLPLIAEGLANKEIAVRLRISVRTAEYHVDQIRMKLGFASRTRVAAWAAEHGFGARPAISS